MISRSDLLQRGGSWVLDRSTRGGEYFESVALEECEGLSSRPLFLIGPSLQSILLANLPLSSSVGAKKISYILGKD